MVSEPPRTPPEEQPEQAIQTLALCETLKKTSVSIAVGTGAQKNMKHEKTFVFNSIHYITNQPNTFKNINTGASLFWGASDQSSVNEGQSVECDPEANSTVSSSVGSEKNHHSREEQSPATPQHSISSPQHKYDVTCCQTTFKSLYLACAYVITTEIRMNSPLLKCHGGGHIWGMLGNN